MHAKAFTSVLAVLFLATTVPPGIVQAADEPSSVREDEKLVLSAGLKDLPTELLSLFRRPVSLAGDRADLAAMVRRLGDPSFDVREKATKDILAVGCAAAPLLQQALDDPDSERSRRAKDCLEAIERGPGPGLLEAAARLLVVHKSPGAAEALLAYLPLAEDDELTDTLFLALAAVGLRDGRADPAILAAVTDPEPIRRAAAAFVLGRSTRADDHRPLVRLLTDTDSLVRLHAARALLREDGKAAVPILIALLAEAPLPVAGQAEGLLCSLAEFKALPPPLQPTVESRQKCSAAWTAWWKERAGRAPLAGEGPRRDLILVADLDVGEILGITLDFKECWRVRDCSGPVDVQLLPSGRLLVAENHGRRITERDRSGKVVWEYKTDSPPGSCWRLGSGNTVITTRERIFEVTPDGKEVWSRKEPDGIWCARRLPSGAIALLTAEDAIVTLTSTGRELQRVEVRVGIATWLRLTVLRNGHYLIPGCVGDRVIEFDRSGQEVWQCHVPEGRGAARLPNGNTVVGDGRHRRVIEVDGDGKIVRELKTGGRPWHVQVVR